MSKMTLSTLNAVANELCVGGKIVAVTIDEGDSITFTFLDGGRVAFSTLGGIEVHACPDTEGP